MKNLHYYYSRHIFAEDICTVVFWRVRIWDGQVRTVQVSAINNNKYRKKMTRNDEDVAIGTMRSKYMFLVEMSSIALSFFLVNIYSIRVPSIGVDKYKVSLLLSLPLN